MRVERWGIAAVVALVLAVVPGLIRHAERPTSVDRVLATATAGAPVGTAPVGDMAITAPATFDGAPAAVASPPPSFGGTTDHGGTYALVVGVNDYPGTRYDLEAAAGDATLLDQALEGFGVPAPHRVLLRDGQASAATVTAALRQLAASGDEQSTLVFAFGGHARKLDRDTEELVLADGATITDQQLADALAPARAKHVWLVIDSCFSGGFTEALGPGRILTASAPANRISYENLNLKASYLSHFLVRKGWLEGGAGRSVQEAFQFADRSIGRLFPNRRPVQIDQAGEPLVLGPGSPVTTSPRVPAPVSTPTPRPATTTTTTAPTAPPPSTPTKVRDCTLLLFCKD